jgi:hypothetical protein
MKIAKRARLSFNSSPRRYWLDLNAWWSGGDFGLSFFDMLIHFGRKHFGNVQSGF